MQTLPMLRYRTATMLDIAALREIIAASVHSLMLGFYSAQQLKNAHGTWLGLDTQLIADGTYYVAETEGDESGSRRIVACGGWSKRKTPYGSDQSGARENTLLDPQTDAAKIRAFFVHPDYARQGIGSKLLTLCENAARSMGFTACEMGATLSGVPLYQAKGYVEENRVDLPLADNLVLPIVMMRRTFPRIILQTERLFLRHWQDSDLHRFADLNADPLVRRYFPTLLSRAESDAEADKIRRAMSKNSYGFWAAELKDDNQFIGFVGLYNVTIDAHFSPAVEIGWRLAHKYWNRGYATEGARAALQYGFESLHQNEIVAYTVTENTASRRVMEKLGMIHNSADDFNHPLLPIEHPMSRHVLYRIRHH